MDYPGDPSPEEQESAFKELHDAAVERWGSDRAEAIETALRRTSLAMQRLDRLTFAPGDVPGFYLHQQRIHLPGGHNR